MTQMEWILLIDDIQMTTGVFDQSVTIPGNNGKAVIPMQMHFDLIQALSGKSTEAVINFGFNLAGIGNAPTRFTLKLKPTINVGGLPVTYPGYINAKTEYKSK